MLAKIPCHLAAVVLVAAASSASAVGPAGLADVAGPRTLALSSGVGLATGSDGLYLNPAALGARTRYAVEAAGFVDRRGSESTAQFFGGSVVDSKTAAVTAGVGYLWLQEGVQEGNSWTVAFAGQIAPKLYVGLSGRYMRLDGAVEGAEDVNAGTADAGLFWQAADYVSIGAAGYNLIPVSNELAAPMGVGAGITIGSEDFFQLTADWRADFDRFEETKNRYGVGAEVLLGRLVPLRAGYQVDEVLDTSWWSAGAGIVSRSGVALDVGYRQSVDDPEARTFAASLRIFLDLDGQ